MAAFRGSFAGQRSKVPRELANLCKCCPLIITNVTCRRRTAGHDSSCDRKSTVSLPPSPFTCAATFDIMSTFYNKFERQDLPDGWGVPAGSPKGTTVGLTFNDEQKAAYLAQAQKAAAKLVEYAADDARFGSRCVLVPNMHQLTPPTCCARVCI